MSGRLTPLGLLVKWLLIPIAVALFGYYVLGKELGNTGLLRNNRPAGPQQPSGGSNIDVPLAHA